jgi:hypothetical protein
MKAANTVAVDLTGTNGVIDDMEAAALHGSTTPSRRFLAAHQAKLAAGPSTRGEDLRFMTEFRTYMNRTGNKT